MKKAINAWAVDPAAGFDRTFSEIKEAGFNGIELNVDEVGYSAHSLTLSISQKELEEIRALSQRYELPVVSISSSLYGGKMGSRCLEDREFAAKLLKKQLECAKALGSSGILTVPGGQCPNIPLDEDFKTSQETLASVKKEIGEAGINVGVENVWNGFFTSPVEMARFIDELDCPFLGAYYDVGNVVAFSWPEIWIEVLGKRIRNVHIKDFKRAGAINQGGRFVDLLEGSVNWKMVIPALEKAGFNGYLTAEVFKEDSVDPTMSYLDFYKSVAKAIDKILEN